MASGHVACTLCHPRLPLVVTVSLNAMRRHYDETFHGWLLAP
jgi:hypothetical protein